MRIYLDSNVFISLIRKEIGRGLRGLFVESESFLRKVKLEKHVIVLSQWFFTETRKKCFLGKNEVLEFFKENRIKTEVIEETKKRDAKQFQQRGLHYSDAIQAVIAIEERCDCIVSFNKRDFSKIKDKINVFEPNEFS